MTLLMVGGGGGAGLTGIPVGPFYQNPAYHAKWEAEYPNWTGGQIPITYGASNAVSLLTAARNAGQQMIVGLAGGSQNFLTGGYFDIVKWKAGMDAAYAAGLESFIEDGTLMASYMIDEPKAPNSWGGVCIANNVLDEMAQYSKSLWPTLPCILRAEPVNLIDHATDLCGPWQGGDYEWQYVDGCWFQYTARKGTITNYAAASFASAYAQDLSIVAGCNWRDGGDGTSGIQSALGRSNWWVVSPSELASYSNGLLNDTYPGAAAYFMWKFVLDTEEPEIMDYWNSAPMQAAFDDLKDLCASRPVVSLLKRSG